MKKIDQLDLVQGDFVPYKKYYTNQTHKDYDISYDVLSCEIIKFWKYSVIFKLYAKIYEQNVKNPAFWETLVYFWE